MELGYETQSNAFSFDFLSFCLNKYIQNDQVVLNLLFFYLNLNMVLEIFLLLKKVQQLFQDYAKHKEKE